MDKYSIGIDLGGTKILTVLINKTTGEVLSFVKKKTKKEKGADKIIKKIVKSIKEVLELSGKTIESIDEIGIGAAGQIDRTNGLILSCPNIQIENISIKQILYDEFGKNILLANDVEAATVGEICFGCGKNENDFVCIFVGTGIGSCIVQNEKIRHGASGTAGEIGHIIVCANGEKCACGAKGCLEAYASRIAIEKKIMLLLEKGEKSIITSYMKPNKPIKSAMLRKAIENNDEMVRKIIDEAAEYLAYGIASVVNFYNPYKIILGGGLINGVEYFYNKTIELAKEKTLAIPAKNMKIEQAKLGDFSGAIGAAMLAEFRSRS